MAFTSGDWLKYLQRSAAASITHTDSLSKRASHDAEHEQATPTDRNSAFVVLGTELPAIACLMLEKETH